MSRRDPKVTLRQIAEYAGRARELCEQEGLLATVEQMLTDLQRGKE